MDEAIDSLDLRRRSTRQLIMQSREEYEASLSQQSSGTPGPSGLGHKRTHSNSSPPKEDGSMSMRGRKRVKEEREAGYRGSRRAIKAQGSRSATTFRHKARIPSKGTRRRLSEEILPVRRSKREKRLIFSNFKQQEIDRQLLKPNAFPVIEESSEEEMDPYEKLLSPHRRILPKREAAPTSFPMSLRSSRQFNPSDVSRGKQASEKEGETETGQEGQVDYEGEAAEGSKEGAGSDEEEEEDEDEEDESDNSEEEEEEEGERGYFLRKRRPVIYQYQPVIQVVEDEAPPKRRGQTTRQRSSFYNKAARSVAPRAYQSRGKTHTISASATRRRAAHRDSTTTTSGSDSDEARFQRRKSRSMKRARMQCLPMNFVPEDATQGVIRDRTRIGASLADVDPMTVDRSVTFDSVGGLGHHIRALKEMIIFPLLYPEVFQRFKIQPPRGVLFYGPPGCGKTLVARALANECSKGGKNVAFFMRKGADCLSKWVGESERQLRLLFDQAYQMRPSIIFFDEIDGLAPVRSTRQDQIHSSIVSTLLALMDGLDARGEIVVIGATNRIDTIDPALRRPGRFDREFLFPLPSREDRLSILSIHTRAWEPALRPDFLAELADNTVGYCGADLKALCTEATLHALRRKYPQIYQTSDKLLLDVSQINVAAADFLNALKAIVPTAQRSDASVACALSERVRPLLITQFQLLLALASFVFPHAWKAIGKAQKNLKVMLACEEEWLQRTDDLVASFCDGKPEMNLVSPSDSHESRSENLILATPKPDFNSFLRAGFSSSGSKSRLNASDLQSTFQSRRASTDKAALRTFSATHSSVSMLSTGGHTYATDTGDRNDNYETSTDAQNRFSELYQCSQPAELAEVYFDMTETVYEEREEGSSRSILVDLDPDKSENPSTGLQTPPSSQDQETPPSGCPSSLDPRQFLSLSTHPHATPSTYRPRLIICSDEGMGQSTHLAPALLHALEDIPVKILDLPGLYATSTKTPEEACTQVFREARRVAPSVVFIPRISSWWGVTTEALQATFLAALLSLPSSTPLLVLATAEEKWEELPRPLRDVFRGVSGESFTVKRPNLAQRRAFFSRVLLEKPLQPPPLKPRPSSEVCHAPLPVAPPPEPRELTQDERTKLEHQRGAVLRELRVFLRDATNKLLAERKFKEYTHAVNPEEVPDYYDIILEPMDLGKIMKKIDEHRYTVPKQWLRDVDLITKNALEYNPEHDSESRLLRHRAVALQDMAHSFLDHELSEDFEKQCEDIRETHQRLEGNPSPVSPPKASSATAAAAATSQTGSASQSGNPPLSGTTEASLLDVAKRRSLRQKGLHPVAEGLPYYAPPKPRTPRKQNKDNTADGTEAMTQNSSPDGMELDQSGSRNSDTGMETPTRKSGEQTQSSVSCRNQNGPSTDELQHEMETDTPRNDVMESENLQRENTGSDSSTRGTERRSLRNSLVKRQLLSDDKVDATTTSVFSESHKKPAAVNGVTHAETRPLSRARKNDSFSSQSLGSISQEQAVANVSASKSGPQVFERQFENQKSASVASEPINISPSSSKTGPSKEPSEGESSEKLNASSLTPGDVNRPVVLDRRRLLAVFEQVTRVTGSCSIEQMEKLHTTFEHLVFRHRMKHERQQLVEDLKTATVLFGESHTQV